MNYYLDFEATQFSQRIISIGCVTEDNRTFYSLVKTDKMLTPFITELTGITNEILENAPTADEVFREFYGFVETTYDDTPPCYYCYGDGDAEFLRHTINHMEDFFSISFAMSIKGNLQDFSQVTKSYFGKLLGLNQIFSFIQAEANVQKHDALLDASMLKTIVENLETKCTPEDLAKMPKSDKVRPPKKEIHPNVRICQKWEGKSRWQANTFGNASKYAFKVIGKRVRYFDSLHTAALWNIQYNLNNLSVKNEDVVKKVEDDITDAIMNHKIYCGMEWM